MVPSHTNTETIKEVQRGLRLFRLRTSKKPMNEEQPNFKVTDRRLFNPDGTPRDVPPEEKPEPKPAPAPESFTAPTAAAEAPASTKSAQPQSATPAAHEPAQPDEDEVPDAEDPAGF